MHGCPLEQLKGNGAGFHTGGVCREEEGGNGTYNALYPRRLGHRHGGTAVQAGGTPWGAGGAQQQVPVTTRGGGGCATAPPHTLTRLRSAPPNARVPAAQGGHPHPGVVLLCSLTEPPPTLRAPAAPRWKGVDAGPAHRRPRVCWWRWRALASQTQYPQAVHTKRIEWEVGGRGGCGIWWGGEGPWATFPWQESVGVGGGGGVLQRHSTMPPMAKHCRSGSTGWHHQTTNPSKGARCIVSWCAPSSRAALSLWGSQCTQGVEKTPCVGRWRRGAGGRSSDVPPTTAWGARLPVDTDDEVSARENKAAKSTRA
jgi:hypothetical protein